MISFLNSEVIPVFVSIDNSVPICADSLLVSSIDRIGLSKLIIFDEPFARTSIYTPTLVFIFIFHRNIQKLDKVLNSPFETSLGKGCIDLTLYSV